MIKSLLVDIYYMMLEYISSASILRFSWKDSDYMWKYYITTTTVDGPIASSVNAFQV